VFTLLVGVAAATINEGNYTVILTGMAAMVSGAISMRSPTTISFLFCLLIISISLFFNKYSKDIVTCQ